MLRNKTHARKERPPAETAAAMGLGPDLRVPVLTELVDALDLLSFLHDPAYRRQLNEVIETLSDEEFDRFERLYTRRFTLN